MRSLAFLLLAAALVGCAAPPPPPGLLTQAELGVPSPTLGCNDQDARGWVRPCPLTSGVAMPAPLTAVRDTHPAAANGANIKVEGGSGGPLRSPRSGRLARLVEDDGRQIGATVNGVTPVFFTHLLKDKDDERNVIYLYEVNGQIHYWPGHGETYYPLPAPTGPATGGR